MVLLCLLGAAVADADDDCGWRACILTPGASKAQFRPPRDRPIDVGCEGGVRMLWLRWEWLSGCGKRANGRPMALQKQGEGGEEAYDFASSFTISLCSSSSTHTHNKHRDRQGFCISN